MKIKQFKKQLKTEEYIIPNVLEKTSEYAKTKVYTNDVLTSSKKSRFTIFNRLVFKYAIVFVLILSIAFITNSKPDKNSSPEANAPNQSAEPQSPIPGEFEKPNEVNSVPKPDAPGKPLEDICDNKCFNYSYINYIFYSTKADDKAQISIKNTYEEFSYNEIKICSETGFNLKIKTLSAEQFCFIAECYQSHCSLEEIIIKTQSKYNIPDEYVYMITDVYNYINSQE